MHAIQYTIKLDSVHLCLGPMPVDTPMPECNTTFQAVVLENYTIQLQWDPVRANLPECPPNLQYCVSYRCCSDMSWQMTTCTTNTAIKFQLNKKQCENENKAVYSVKVEGSNYHRYMTMNLENYTGMKGKLMLKKLSSYCLHDCHGSTIILPLIIEIMYLVINRSNFVT